MNQKWKRILELAALFLFCAATFLIVEEHFLPCAVCFAAAAVMLGVSRRIRKPETERKSTCGHRYSE